ncbi:MAG: TolC family protein [Deltaproteobacteria bacterium]|nr:TolC family protein [Deltaproteobacteria bacterium]
MKAHILRIIFFILWLLGSGQFLFAQEALTLKEALETALRQNPGLRAAGQSLEQARHGLVSARAKVFPALSLAGNYQYTWDRPEYVMTLPLPPILGGNTEIKMPTGAEHTFTGAVVLEQPLFTGGALSAGIGIASDALKTAKLGYRAAEQQTIENVYSAFYGVLLTQSLIEVAEGAVKNAQTNLNQVEKRYREGAASRFERLRAQVQLATIRPNLTEARNSYETAVEHLKDLLGLDKQKGITVTGFFEPRRDTLLSEDINTLVEKAYTQRPEYQMQRLQKDIGAKKVRLARAEFFPILALSSALQWQAQKDDFSVGGDDFERTFYAGVSLRIPIFEGLGSKARYGEARAELRKTEIEEENLKNLIATEIRTLYNELIQAQEILQSQKEVVAQAKEGLRLANLLYEEGAATLLEVIDAQLAATQAGTSYYRAIYQFNTASIKLERAVGSLKTDSIL